MGVLVRDSTPQPEKHLAGCRIECEVGESGGGPLGRVQRVGVGSIQGPWCRALHLREALFIGEPNTLSLRYNVHGKSAQLVLNEFSYN